ncbi:MAG: hypothetical protein QM703_01875 [Gemmatales bacterium]
MTGAEKTYTEDQLQEAAQHILYFFDLIDQNPGIGDPNIVEGLTAHKPVPQLHAHLMCQLVPEAIAYLILRDAGMTAFPTTFKAINEKGDLVEFSLNILPYFSLAVNLATAAAESKFTQYCSQGTLQNTALRSATMHGINHFLQSGHELKEIAGGRLEPLIVQGISAEQIAALG